MPNGLTLGDLLNIGMVAGMWATLVYTRHRHRTEDDDSLALELKAHLIECARRSGELETTVIAVKKDVEKVERKVDHVSAQVRLLATDASDRFTITERRVTIENED